MHAIPTRPRGAKRMAATFPHVSTSQLAMTLATATGSPVVRDSTTLKVAAVDDTQSANESSATGQPGGEIEERLHLSLVTLVGLLATARCACDRPE